MRRVYCMICGDYIKCTISWNNNPSEHDLLLDAVEYEHNQEYHPLYYAIQMGIV